MKSSRSSSGANALLAASAPAARLLGNAAVLGWAIPLAVVVLSGLAFAPVLQNEFVNWDDRVNVLDNRAYRGLSWSHLQWMLTTFHNSLYRPLTWITLGADYLAWGMNPAGYHLTSLLLHCAAALSFYYLSVQLLSLAVDDLSDRAGLDIHIAAGFAALLFAVHPLRVEPIAWVSGRENVVAAPFFILTVVCYLRAVSAHGASAFSNKWMAASWLSYALSLLGKGAGVTLPLALVILDLYPLRRLGTDPRAWLRRSGARVWLEKIPFFVLALIAGLLAVYGKRQSNLMYGLDEYGVIERAVQTVYGLVFYLWKTLLPIGLSNLYEIESLSPYDWRLISSAALLAGATIFLWMFRRRWPWGLAAWVFYIVVLLPYVGVAQNGPQIAADRYCYLACLGWAVLGGAALLATRRGWQNGTSARPLFVAARAGAIVVVATLGILSWQQSKVWRNSETLWRHALAINDNSFFAHHFFGNALLARNQTAQASEHFQRSLALNPRYVSARVGLANALAEQGDLETSAREYRRALELEPDSLGAHYGLARVLAKRGEVKQAIEHYKRALTTAPDDPDTHNNLGLLLAARGEENQAIEHFSAALQSDPGYARAHFNLGRTLAQQGRVEEAIGHLRAAARLEPGVAEIHESLGRVLAAQGKRDEAATHLEEAVRILKGQRPAP
jgi:protein O-mannosyl-transferase